LFITAWTHVDVVAFGVLSARLGFFYEKNALYKFTVIIITVIITTSMDDQAETMKRIEQNRIRSGKSEAEVTNNKRLRSTYCTIEANYWVDRKHRAASLRQQCYLSAGNDIIENSKFAQRKIRQEEFKFA